MGTIETNAQPSRQSKDRHNGGSAPLLICLPSSRRIALVASPIIALLRHKFRRRSVTGWTRLPCICASNGHGLMMQIKSSSTSRVTFAKSVFFFLEASPSNAAIMSATKAPDIGELFSSMLRRISCALLASLLASQPPLSSLGAKTHNFYHRTNGMSLANLPSPPFNWSSYCQHWYLSQQTQRLHTVSASSTTSTENLQ